jgi:O-antigen/teichoic acid export membrane protein
MSIIEWEYLGVLIICFVAQMINIFRGDERWRIWAILANGINALVDFGSAIYYILHGKPVSAVEDLLWGTFALLIVLWLWRNWKDKKKVKEVLGAKSKALRDKLVKKARESAQPRPVRIPA